MNNLLALNMIVARNESRLVKRCLDTIPKGLFNQIVIVNTSDDTRIDDVVKEYGGTCIHFQWSTKRHPHGDFAGARNCALDNTKTKYVMWLDTDDIFLPVHASRLMKFKEFLLINCKLDSVLMEYVIVSDLHGNPVTSFMRERVFRVDERFRWINPVHEQLTIDIRTNQYVCVEGIAVTHAPIKPVAVGADRNIRILKHELTQGVVRKDEYLFFLARDLLSTQCTDRAFELLEEAVRRLTMPMESAYVLCVEAAMFLMFGRQVIESELEQIKRLNLEHAERFLRIALSFSDRYAEPYVLLGDIYMLQELDKNAENMYRQALTKKLLAGSTQTLTFYERTPCDRLASLNAKKHDLEKALWYARRVSDCYKNQDRRAIQKRIEIMVMLENEIEQQLQIIEGGINEQA